MGGNWNCLIGTYFMINEKLTYKKFGYYSADLKPHSHKFIIAICENCHKLRNVMKQDYRALCKSCVKKGKNSPLYKDGRCLKTYYCKNCNKKISMINGLYGGGKCHHCCNLGRKRSDSFHKKYSKGNHWKWNQLCLNCVNCGRFIWRSPCRLKRSKNLCCSQRCAFELILKKGLRKGSNHFNWKNGVSKLPYPMTWTEELKKQIRHRDNYTCQICGKSEKKNAMKLCIHHIDYNKKNCKENNLISLCKSCHTPTHYNRKYWETKLQRLVI